MNFKRLFYQILLILTYILEALKYVVHTLFLHKEKISCNFTLKVNLLFQVYLICTQLAFIIYKIKCNTYIFHFSKDHQCDEKSNGPHFLTDLHNPNNVTCWKSDFVNADVTENVTLTVSLKKKYELTYVSLHFCHAKPHSMAIYKRYLS